MKPLVFNFPSSSHLGMFLTKRIGAEESRLSRKSFPDGESYLRLESPVEGRLIIIKVITCNTIPHPSNQIDLSPLLLTTLKEIQQ